MKIFWKSVEKKAFTVRCPAALGWREQVLYYFPAAKASGYQLWQRGKGAPFGFAYL